MPYYAKSNCKPLIVLSVNSSKCLTSINMFADSESSLQENRFSIDSRYDPNESAFPKDFLQSNSVPPDHEAIHVFAGSLLNKTSEETQNNSHWHWSVWKPSKANNSTAIIFLASVRLVPLDPTFYFEMFGYQPST